MSHSPGEAADKVGMERYAGSWGQLMAAVRGGASWSGGERNRCFLNMGGERFVNASHLSGLDFDDDGRAMAVCDWDRDGDLDIWLRNRTAPRLRLMLNRGGMAGRSVALRLQGTNCNRDAIGAVVEVRSGGPPIVRSVRAGEMFLSQSSKWLHFGLGEKSEVGEVLVRWPGGETEPFRGVAVGGRYVLKESEGVAVPVGDLQAASIEPNATQATGNTSKGAQIYLPVAVPLPRLAYRDRAAKPAQLVADGKTKLLLIWESSCEVCGRELAQIEQKRGLLAGAGIDVLALTADGIETAGDAYERIDTCSFSSPWGFIDQASLAALWRWQVAMFDRQPPASVPLGLLLDGAGRCVAIYRGRTDVDALIGDAKRLIGIDPATRWHLAPPLAGTWFTNPVPEVFVRALLRLRGGG